MERKTRVGRPVLSAGEYTVSEVFEAGDLDERVIGFSVTGQGVSGLMVHPTLKEALEILEAARLP